MKSHDWVLDTKVLISAALSLRGSPYALVQDLLANARLVFSAPTFEELRSRIYRAKFNPYISLDPRERILRDLSACAIWVEISPEQKGWSRDPDGDKFIATALQVPAAVLVNRDRDPLDAVAPAGLQILTAAQACQGLRSAVTRSE